MRITSPQSFYPTSPPRGAMGQAQSPKDVSFSAMSPKTVRRVSYGILGAALMALMPVKVTAQPSQASDVTVLKESKTPVINRAADLEDLLDVARGSLIELAENPLFSASTQRELMRLMDDYNLNGKANLAAIVIPKTTVQPDQMPYLAKSLMTGLRVSDPGKENGILLVLNADAIRNNTGVPFSIGVGSDLESQLSRELAGDLLKAHALPHLQRGDVNAAARETLEALKSLAETGKTAKVKAPNTIPPGAIQGAILLAALALLILGACAARDIQQKDYDMPRTMIALELVLRILVVVASQGKGGSSSSGGGRSRGGGGGFSRGGGGGI